MNNENPIEQKVSMTMLCKCSKVLPLLADALGIPQKEFTNAGVGVEAAHFQQDGVPFRQLSLDLPAPAEDQEEQVMHVVVFIDKENSVNFPAAFLRAKKATVKLTREEAKRCKESDMKGDEK